MITANADEGAQKPDCGYPVEGKVNLAVSYEATSAYYATDPDISGIYLRNR